MTISTNTTPQYMNNDSLKILTRKIGMNTRDSANAGPAVCQSLNCLSTLDKNVNGEVVTTYQTLKEVHYHGQNILN